MVISGACTINVLLAQPLPQLVTSVMTVSDISNGTAHLKNVNNCLNTNIYSYLETSGVQSSNPYLNVLHFFNARVNQKSVAAQGSCFPALVSNMCCSIVASLTDDSGGDVYERNVFIMQYSFSFASLKMVGVYFWPIFYKISMDRIFQNQRLTSRSRIK